MVLEKKQLSLSDFEAQTALELPHRETLCSYLVTFFDESGEPMGSMESGDVNIAIQACQQFIIANVIVVGAEQRCRIQQQG